MTLIMPNINRTQAILFVFFFFAKVYHRIHFDFRKAQ